MVRKQLPIIFMAITCLMINCRKSYTPRVVADDNRFLVVEGNVDPGTDSTVIRLSRTAPVAAGDSVRPELHASVTVESDTHDSYPLADAGNGYYVSAGLKLNLLEKYCLKITTTENKSYQSDYLPVKNAPPIDSVYYLVQNNGVTVYADTHDASNKTIYYRWQCQETYQIHSLYDSHFVHVKIPKDTILNRPQAEQIYTCWITGYSNNIAVNSSAQLSADVISRNNVIFLPSSSEKIEDRYSVLVKQYALTKEAFAYWEQLKKNTEQLGSIFDPQPGDLPGNIHSLTTPSEPVIGFIGVGSFSSARIYIDTHDLPVWRPERPYYENCAADTINYTNPKTGENQVKYYLYSDFEIPISEFGDLITGRIAGFSAAPPRCVDCTLRGANKPPPFWKAR